MRFPKNAARNRQSADLELRATALREEPAHIDRQFHLPSEVLRRIRLLQIRREIGDMPALQRCRQHFHLQFVRSAQLESESESPPCDSARIRCQPMFPLIAATFHVDCPRPPIPSASKERSAHQPKSTAPPLQRESGTYLRAMDHGAYVQPIGANLRLSFAYATRRNKSGRSTNGRCPLRLLPFVVDNGSADD